MKMRSISEAFSELKSVDPKTALTLSGLRRLVNSGMIPSIKIGRRILVDYDSLVHHLKHPMPEQNSDSKYGQVRKIITQ
jgi:hypothetical protein